MPHEALIFYGGWEGHQPEATTEIVADWLMKRNFHVFTENTLDVLESNTLNQFDLIIPNWTMGPATSDQFQNLKTAVKNGTGLAGFHGGMGDAFRSADVFQEIVGSQFVSHPGGQVRYEVNITDKQNPITEDIEDFEVNSEQYYLHVDPSILSGGVLATTHFPALDGPPVPNGPVEMPVAYTKKYFKGNVFYVSLGHAPEILELPPVSKMLIGGMLWAAGQLVAKEVTSDV